MHPIYGEYWMVTADVSLEIQISKEKRKTIATEHILF